MKQRACVSSVVPSASSVSARTALVKATQGDAGGMPDLLDLPKARKELETKDLLTIERETALTWGGRAAASYGFVLEEGDHAERMRCFWEAETYRGEAVEHAAMTEDSRFVERLTTEIEGHRAKARELLLAAGHEFVQGSRTPKASRPPQPNRAERLAARPQPRPATPAQAPDLAWETVEDEPAVAPPAAPPSPKPLPKAEKSTSVPRPPPAIPGLGRRPENENRLA